MLVPFRRLVLLSALFLGLLPVPTLADFITETTVSYSVAYNGLYRYEYYIHNNVESDLPLGAFQLNVAPEAYLQSITGPIGWDISYFQTDAFVVWGSAGYSTDVLPGTSATFSFLSPLGPSLQPFLTAGFDESTLRGGSNEGLIASPAVLEPVPEPTSLSLFGSGASLSLLLYLLGRARQWMN